MILCMVRAHMSGHRQSRSPRDPTAGLLLLCFIVINSYMFIIVTIIIIIIIIRTGPHMERTALEDNDSS